MPAFSYTAINEAGIKKKGILSANSEREARRLVKDLQLTPLKITESKDITKSKKLLLFKLRTKMVHVNHNYGVKSLCKICNQGPDDQDHLTQCLFLKLKVPEILNLKENEYMDIFGENCTKMKHLAEIFESILRQREILIEKQKAKQIKN